MRRLSLMLLLFVLLAAPAAAHGEIEGTIPEAGSRVGKPVAHLAINFTEPPTKEARITVRDGCGHNVVDDVQVEGQVAHVYTQGGEPGRWRIRYKVVSALDGHKTEGGYSLTVEGSKDCTPEGPNDNGANGGDGPRADPPAPDGDTGEESDLPVIPIVLGSAAVVGLAFLARRAAG